MKKILLSLIMVLIIISCEKKTDDLAVNDWINGLWTSEQNDSLCFSTFLFINNSFPYDYNIKNDTIKIFPIWSSNSNDLKSYKIEIDKSNEEFYLFAFNDNEKLLLKKRKNKCN